MKRFRISFLAIIAVLSIGLTAATKADTAKAKLVPVANCYTELTVTDCLNESTLDDAILCGDADNIPKVNFADPTFFIEQDNELCSGQEVRFCCATLVVDPLPCATGQEIIEFVDEAGDDQTDFAKIETIYCKPE